MKRLAGLSVLALTLSATSGCSWIWGDEGYFRDRGSDYMHERRAAPMQLPEGQESRRLDPLLPIPDHVADVRSTGKFEVPRPEALLSSNQVSEFSLQTSGASRWLLAQRNPAESWPLVRQFLDDNGVKIAEERPQTGEFISEWQRTSELSSALGRQLNASNEAQVRLRVRVEPGVQRNTSEIFIVAVERAADSASQVDWPAGNTSDVGLLTQLLNSMESAGENGSVSLLAARDYDAPDRVNLSSDGSGNPVLRLDTDINRAWSSVGRALEKADVRVDDLNRSTGVYFINLSEAALEPEKPGFFGRVFGSGDSKEEIEARAERYQVRLAEVSGRVEITVQKDSNTLAPEEVSRRILDLIQNNLG